MAIADNRDALRVSYVTIAWSGIDGVAAVEQGLQSRSLALVGVGAALALDVLSSLVLVWRFKAEHGHLGPERLAARVARIALAAVAIGLVSGSVERLATHKGPTVGALPITIAIAGLVVLPLLACWKFRVAKAVRSASLRTDAQITAVGAVMSGVTLLGLALTSLVGWWWADAIAGLAVAALALRTALSPGPPGPPATVPRR